MQGPSYQTNTSFFLKTEWIPSAFHGIGNFTSIGNNLIKKYMVLLKGFFFFLTIWVYTHKIRIVNIFLGGDGPVTNIPGTQ